MLKNYVGLGMIVFKVHQNISFKQKEWMENYTSFKTQKRRKAKNKLGKGFCKLINNGFFGKKLNNIRNRKKIDFF